MGNIIFYGDIDSAERTTKFGQFRRVAGGDINPTKQSGSITAARHSHVVSLLVAARLTPDVAIDSSMLPPVKQSMRESRWRVAMATGSSIIGHHFAAKKGERSSVCWDNSRRGAGGCG